ncbi:hypothetical protein DORI_92 [Mycobacterium phage Dori]|uniref:hypothetical protein n=1 Tax=Mycobacterium phage Dori TaxID=1089121 RepID=UPI000232F592|nr:hypothetical protein DORI_92 [Mycobacterium phage Dori]AER47741.1 hypothetical protein DORI_92 [Mycobacterium phage Dori]
MTSTNDQFRITALVEANKWAGARAGLNQHPGTGNVVEAAETFLKFLKGEPAANGGAAE